MNADSEKKGKKRRLRMTWSCAECGSSNWYYDKKAPSAGSRAAPLITCRDCLKVGLPKEFSKIKKKKMLKKFVGKWGEAGKR